LPKKALTVLAAILALIVLTAYPPRTASMLTERAINGGTPAYGYPSGDPQVLYFPSEKVKAAFAANGTLLGGHENGRNFTILTARRDGPGVVEIHRLDTDVFYIVQGSATFITGGTALDTKTTAPDEIRGTAIRGGESHHLAQGDVMVIPKGVPHWFKEVEPPFLYFVVKVRR